MLFEQENSITLTCSAENDFEKLCAGTVGYHGWRWGFFIDCAAFL